jgi:electron transport complex protein RnfD
MMAEQAEQEKKEEKQAEAKVLEVSSSPHLQDESTSRQVMLEVSIGTLPAAIMSVYLFRVSALVVLFSCVIAGILTEWIFNAVRKKTQTILDGSALVTCLILGLSLPPTFPWWGCVIGSVAAIGVAKMLFGGLGANIFNPAMVGRAFLMACFGTLMTTWVITVPQYPEYETTAQEQGIRVDAVTQPTPLALAKQAVKTDAKLKEMKLEIERLQAEGALEQEIKKLQSDYKTTQQAQVRRLETLNQTKQNMFMGDISGSVGETSALLWLLGGIFLLWRRTITFHIPVAVLGSALALATGAWLINSEVYPNPLVHLCGGGLMMCAFFIATDPVSCPLSKSGRVIFGIGVGVLIMLIRLIGGYPEGVMYAVLLMNSMTPLLDRWTRPTPLGGHVKKG